MPVNSDASALQLILTGDPALFAIVRLSLFVSLSALAVSALIGIPLGAGVALIRFRGREAVIVLLNALMGLPPVVVGLAVYLMLSRSGPLGSLGILFTPAAMVIAQTILALPVIAALARQLVADALREGGEQLHSLGAGTFVRAALMLLHERWAVVTLLLIAFGRAIAEVGAVMIVGGNIDGYTRVMTTTIALETSKGDLPLALALGMVLLAVVALLNVLVALVPRGHAVAVTEWR